MTTMKRIAAKTADVIQHISANSWSILKKVGVRTQFSSRFKIWTFCRYKFIKNSHEIDRILLNSYEELLIIKADNSLFKLLNSHLIWINKLSYIWEICYRHNHILWQSQLFHIQVLESYIFTDLYYISFMLILSFPEYPINTKISGQIFNIDFKAEPSVNFNSSLLMPMQIVKYLLHLIRTE